MSYYTDLDMERGVEFEIDEHERELREQRLCNKIGRLTRQYKENKQAEIGTTIKCAWCGKRIIKTTYHKKFCSNGKTRKGKWNCKDKYWNLVDEKRRFRALDFK